MEGWARLGVLVVEHVGLNVCVSDSDFYVMGMVALLLLWVLGSVPEAPFLWQIIPLLWYNMCWCREGLTLDTLWMCLCILGFIPNVFKVGEVRDNFLSWWIPWKVHCTIVWCRLPMYYWQGSRRILDQERRLWRRQGKCFHFGVSYWYYITKEQHTRWCKFQSVPRFEILGIQEK